MNLAKYSNKEQSYILDVANESDKATMLLHGAIGEDIDGFKFAEQMLFLADLGVKEIDVRINSVGGSVIHGFSIFSAMQDPRIKVNTINDGLAASMASHILMAGSGKRMGRDFSKVMVHDVNGIDETDENGKNAADSMRDSLKVMYSRKTKMGTAEINDIFSGKKDIWLNAEQALAKGFINEIIETGKVIEMTPEAENDPKQFYKIASQLYKDMNKKNIKNGASLGAVVEAMIGALIFKQGDQVTRESIINQIAEASQTDESTIEAYIGGEPNCPPPEAIMAMAQVLQVDANILFGAGNADGCAYTMQGEPEEEDEGEEMEEMEDREDMENEGDHDKMKNKTQNKNRTMEGIKNFFKEKNLEVKNEQEFINAYKDLEGLKNALSQQVEDLTEALNAANEDKATALVEAAINEGKIKEDAKEKWVEFATEKYDLAKSSLDSIHTPAQKITDELKAEIKNSDRESWTIRDWEKKDPKGLRRIQNETPEIYKQMYNEFYAAKA